MKHTHTKKSPRAIDPVYDSENSEDAVSKTRTLYDVPTSEVIWRNFLAGMSRSLGSIVMYFLFFTVIATVIGQVIWPRIKPFVDASGKTLQMFGQIGEAVPSVQTSEVPEENENGSTASGSGTPSGSTQIQITLPSGTGEINRDDVQRRVN